GGGGGERRVHGGDRDGAAPAVRGGVAGRQVLLRPVAARVVRGPAGRGRHDRLPLQGPGGRPGARRVRHGRRGERGRGRRAALLLRHRGAGRRAEPDHHGEQARPGDGRGV